MLRIVERGWIVVAMNSCVKCFFVFVTVFLCLNQAVFADNKEACELIDELFDVGRLEGFKNKSPECEVDMGARADLDGGLFYISYGDSKVIIPSLGKVELKKYDRPFDAIYFEAEDYSGYVYLDGTSAYADLMFVAKEMGLNSEYGYYSLLESVVEKEFNYSCLDGFSDHDLEWLALASVQIPRDAEVWKGKGFIGFWGKSDGKVFLVFPGEDRDDLLKVEISASIKTLENIVKLLVAKKVNVIGEHAFQVLPEVIGNE